MKRLITNFITDTVGQPIKQGTLDFLQDAHKETANALARQILGETYAPNFVFILTGCQNSGSGGSYIISEGYVFYNGEVYYYPGGSFSVTGTNTAVGVIVQSPTTAPNADPVTFTDLSTHSVHIDRTWDVQNLPSAGLTDFSYWIDSRSKLSRLEFKPYGTGTAGVDIIYASSNFANDGGGTYEKMFLHYHPRENKVTLSGVVSVTTLATGNSVVANLPLKYRPDNRLQFPLIIDDSPAVPLVGLIYDGGDIVISNNTGGSLSSKFIGINITWFVA